jgi:hypothetical protein
MEMTNPKFLFHIGRFQNRENTRKRSRINKWKRAEELSDGDGEDREREGRAYIILLLKSAVSSILVLRRRWI